MANERMGGGERMGGEGTEPINRLADDIEVEFGVNLTEQIDNMLASGEAMDIAVALEKISALLTEAGAELDEDRKQRLLQILQDNLR